MDGKAGGSPELDGWLASQLSAGIAGWSPEVPSFERLLVARRRQAASLRRRRLAAGVALAGFGLFLFTSVPTMAHLVATLFGAPHGVRAVPVGVAPHRAEPSPPSTKAPEAPPSDHPDYLMRVDPVAARPEVVARSHAAGGPPPPASPPPAGIICAWANVCPPGQLPAASGDRSMSAQDLRQLAEAWALAERKRAPASSRSGSSSR